MLSVHASNDGLSTPADIEAHKAELPAEVIMTDMTTFSLPLQSKSHYYEIQGGNHAQFVHIPEHTHPLIPVELSLQEQQ